jgi:uncharacterized protein
MTDTAGEVAAEALQRHEVLVAALQRSAAFGHPADRIERIDTHISTVLLAGDYAYKLKKPVSLGFLDFSTLEKRRLCCDEEVRLNRRTAPWIYLDVVPIVGTPENPRIGSSRDPEQGTLDFAVRMRRFDHDLALDRVAGRGQLTADHVDRLAAAVARLHSAAQRAPTGYGTPEVIARWSDENFVSLRERTLSAVDRARIDALDEWSSLQLRDHSPLMAERAAAGFVRECHGDLHLANVVLLDAEPVPFDSIEFNAELRYIDVISDIAFTFMDLADHKLPHFAWRFVSSYLEHTGDYDGLALLRFYAAYRALVRAKVALIHLQQPQLARHTRLREYASFEHYLALAEHLHRQAAPRLIVMCGLSGSGKSTAAQALVERLGGVRIRSDVERKRLHGLAPAAASGGTIYTPEHTARTYARLAEAARAAVGAGVTAIVDAAFLRRAERARFAALATELGARYRVVYCDAPREVLRARVAARHACGGDPSEADLAVLERQFEWAEALDEAELRSAIRIDTAAGIDSVRAQLQAWEAV